LRSKPKACPVDFARGLLSVYINPSLMRALADDEPI